MNRFARRESLLASIRLLAPSLPAADDLRRICMEVAGIPAPERMSSRELRSALNRVRADVLLGLREPRPGAGVRPSALDEPPHKPRDPGDDLREAILDCQPGVRMRPDGSRFGW